MVFGPKRAVALGAVLVGVLALVSAQGSDARFVDNLAQQADAAIAEAGGEGVSARFITRGLWPTRHPVLSGGEALDEGTRADIAQSLATIPGIGGISWEDGTVLAEAGQIPTSPSHCQNDVKALLAARSIRFEESSSAIATSSEELLDEVAAALRPCLGSIIAITGHTDASGAEPNNLTLSQQRANAVKQALLSRGIPENGLRAKGLGSGVPIDGLAATDPANRRIEFAVVSTLPVVPTPVDTPGPR